MQLTKPLTEKKPGFFRRLQNTIARPFRGPIVDWESLKCCGKKRMHNQATGLAQSTSFPGAEKYGPPGYVSIERDSITRRSIAANNMNAGSIFNQHRNEQFVFERPSITSNMSMRIGGNQPHTNNQQEFNNDQNLNKIEQQQLNGYKRPRNELSHNSFKSFITDQNRFDRDHQLYGSLQQYNKQHQDQNNGFDLIRMRGNSLEPRSRSYSLLNEDPKTLREQKEQISSIDDQIKSKQFEIEQLIQLKEQHILQSQVNQVSINNSIGQSNNGLGFQGDQVRQPVTHLNQGLSKSHIQEKQLFNISGLFEQPYNKTHIFNTSKSTINPVNTNMNTSFDTTLSRQNNHDFNIPFMLQRRAQNVDSSQTKYTIDSLLDDPVPFRSQLRVSNFQNYSKNQDQIFAQDVLGILEINLPRSEDIQKFKLPLFSKEDLVALNENILSQTNEFDDQIVQESITCNDSKITIRDIKKLCKRSTQVESSLINFYIKLIVQELNKQQNTQVLIFTQEDLDVDQEEWNDKKSFIQAKIQENQVANLAFICTFNNQLTDDSEIILYLITPQEMKVTYFQSACQINKFRLDLYENRVRQVHQLYSQEYFNKRQTFHISIQILNGSLNSRIRLSNKSSNST
eukprot:403335767